MKILAAEKESVSRLSIADDSRKSRWPGFIIAA
jgi:hypothetical protein